MKKCLHCQDELDAKARVCPKCGKPCADEPVDEPLNEKERQIVEERLRSLGYL
jgi:predicted amidophosphoribosyltransferase